MGKTGSKRRLSEVEYDLGPFLARELPIFWIMGPPKCGKSTLAAMLARCSKYDLLKMSRLIKDEAQKDHWRGKLVLEYLNKGNPVPDEIVIVLLIEKFVSAPQTVIGYIIDGFPLTIRQAELFEKRICKSSMVIYITLALDAVLARVVHSAGRSDENAIRIQHIEHTKRLDGVFRKFEHKAIKLHSNYTPEETCTRLLENLEDFWGYKFQRLYNKN